MTYITPINTIMVFEQLIFICKRRSKNLSMNQNLINTFIIGFLLILKENHQKTIMHQEKPNHNNKKSIIPAIDSGYDVCGNFTPEQMMGSISDISIELNDSHQDGPKYEEYSTLDSRKVSFIINEWNPKVAISIDSLAESGFFAIGLVDYVKCFHCDGGLCNWESEDEPWIEHAKWYPDCAFLKENKSDVFIKKCKILGENEIQDLKNSLSAEYRSLGYDTKEQDTDSLRKRTIIQWLNSDMVKSLENFDHEIIKAVLERRWRQTKTFYTCFEDLHSSVSQWKCVATKQIKSTSSNWLNKLIKFYFRLKYLITRLNRSKN